MTPFVHSHAPRRWCNLSLALCLAAGLGQSILHAHRLDECLQTTFVTLWPDRLELDLVLAPGVAVASQVLSGMDPDSDGVISPAEADAYAAALLQAVSVELDGTSRALRVAAREFPAPERIREGQGLIRIQLVAAFPRISTGAHALTFRNDHLPHLSVYLVNATLPPSPEVRITGQHRDSEQRSTRIGFSVSDTAP